MSAEGPTPQLRLHPGKGRSFSEEGTGWLFLLINGGETRGELVRYSGWREWKQNSGAP